MALTVPAWPVPRTRLAVLPTPLVAAPRLADELGVGSLLIKRDDLTGFAMGGNKIRSLEFLLAAATRGGADTVVTGGAPTSNFCAAAAAAALSAGRPPAGRSPADRTRRQLLDAAEISEAELTELVEVEEDHPFVLHPGEFVLGSTLERVRLPDDLVARLEGKSSLGRLGLLIHSTAGYVDPGWKGTLTLELSNVANLPIALYAGMRIGQISFFRMSSAVERPYGSPELGSKYQGQAEPTASAFHRDFAATRRTEGSPR